MAWQRLHMLSRTAVAAVAQRHCRQRCRAVGGMLMCFGAVAVMAALNAAAGRAAASAAWSHPFASGSTALRPLQWRSSRRGGRVIARRSGGEPPNALYEVLGVDTKASVTDIKKAYYREAKRSHPDKYPGDEKMFARFQAVAEAYQTLADPLLRQEYDLSGLAGLASMNINATRLFGPPPWRVLIGRTDHWLWGPNCKESFLGLMIASIPNGIAGVTLKTIELAYQEAFDTRVAVLLERVSEEQAKDTVQAIEEFGLAVKAEPIEAERTHEEEPPLMYYQRMQRELGEAADALRQAAADPDDPDQGENSELSKQLDIVKQLRSQTRAARAAYEAAKAEKEREAEKAKQEREKQEQEEEHQQKEEVTAPKPVEA